MLHSGSLLPILSSEHRDCSPDSEVDRDRTGDRFYTTGPNLLSQGSSPCSDRVKTCQTPLKALSTSRTFPRRNLWRTTVTTRTPPVPEKKVCSPHLEKALTFLDDTLLPATSHAVERGNRRHRKMQKSVYRVRSKVCLEGRIALDMIRESRSQGRDQTTQALHQARRGYT